MDDESDQACPDVPELMLESEIGSWVFHLSRSDEECSEVTVLGEDLESRWSEDESDGEEEEGEDGLKPPHLTEHRASAMAEMAGGRVQRGNEGVRGDEMAREDEDISQAENGDSLCSLVEASGSSSSASDSTSSRTSDSEESEESGESFCWNYLEAFPGRPIVTERNVEVDSEEPWSSDSTTDPDEDEDEQSTSEDDDVGTMHSSSCSVEVEADGHSEGEWGTYCNCRKVKGLLTHDRGCALDNQLFWAMLQWADRSRRLKRSPRSYEVIFREVCDLVGNLWTASGSSLFHLASFFERGLEKKIEESVFLAVFLYCESVRRGHVQALVCLARLVEFGTLGAPLSVSRAKNLYRRIARLQHPSALYAGAYLAGDGDPSVASDMIEQASRQGDIHALCHADGGFPLKGGPFVRYPSFKKDIFDAVVTFNHCYFCVNNALFGLVVINMVLWEDAERDVDESVRLLRLLVDRGHVGSHHLLALVLEHGTSSISENHEEALSLHKVLAKYTHFSDSLYHLALLLKNSENGCEQDIARAENCLELASKRGHAESSYVLANMHHHGEHGLPVDGKRAEKFYRAAVEQGHAKAKSALAFLVGNGSLGVSRNPEEAKRLFRQALEDGYPMDKLTFAVALLHGLWGIPQDEKEGYSILSELNSGDYFPAALHLGFFYMGHHLDEQEEKEMAKLNWREAERLLRIGVGPDLSLATYELGYLNELLDWDYEERIQLHRIAAGLGHPGALYHLALRLMFSPEWDQIQGYILHVVSLLRKAVEEGSSCAPYTLGNILKEGDENVEKNAVEAVQLFSIGMSRGDPEAAYQLGCMLEIGDEDVPQDFPRALEIYEEATNMGSLSALLRLAELYAHGCEDLLPDRRRAAAYYSVAIEMGHTYSMFKLATLLHFGSDDLPRDAEGAKRFYRMAIEKGDTFSMYGLGDLMEAEGESKEAFELYEKAADLGNMDARLRLAYMLFDGADGVKKDETRAHELLRSCIEEGMKGLSFGTNVKHVSPHVALGDIKENGNYGVQKDAAEAAALYHTAAQNEQPEGYMFLGKLLERGDDGVPKDPAAAVEYYQLAIEAGITPCLYLLGRLLERGDEGVGRNVEGAISLYRTAWLRGDADAMHRLGEIYEHGYHGVQKDLLQAGVLYGLAGHAGKAESLCNLGLLLFYGRSGVRRDKKKGKKFLRDASIQGSLRARLHLWKLRLRRIVTLGVAGFFCVKFLKVIKTS